MVTAQSEKCKFRTLKLAGLRRPELGSRIGLCLGWRAADVRATLYEGVGPVNDRW